MSSRASKKDEDAFRSYDKKAKEQEAEKPVPKPAAKHAVKLCPKCNVPLNPSEKPDYMRCNTCTWLYDKDQWKEGSV